MRSWADLRLWHNVHYIVSLSNDKPGLTQHKDVVWMNHATAMQVAGDFVPYGGLDGGYFLLTPATDCPHLTAEMRAGASGPSPRWSRSRSGWPPRWTAST